MRRRNICFNIGLNWVSLEDLYPRLQERTQSPERQPPIHIAAAYWDPHRQHWGAVHDEYRHVAQHYLIAFPAGPPKSGVPRARLDVQLQQLGYMMILTVAQGDCGIDALAYHDNDFLHTSAVEWKKLRHELSRHMMEHAEDPMWQSIFKACGEMPEENPGVRKRKERDDFAVGRCVSGVNVEDEVFNSEADEKTNSEADSFDEYFGLDEVKSPSDTAGAPPVEPSRQAELSGEVPPVVEIKAPEVADVPVLETVSGERAPAEPSDPKEQGEGGSATQGAAPSDGPETGATANAVVPSGSDSTVLSRPSAFVEASVATGPAEVSESSGRTVSAACSRWSGGGNRNPAQLRDHLRTLDVQELRKISDSMEAFKTYEKKFFQEHPPPSRKRADQKTALPTQVQNWNATLHRRMALGRAYQIWLATQDGQAAVQSGCQRRAFLAAGTERSHSEISKAETQRLARAWELVLQQDLLEGRLDKEKEPADFALAQKFKERTEKKRIASGQEKSRAVLHFSVGPGAVGEAGGMFRRVCYGGLPHKYRRRQFRFQGRKFKCPALREELYDWFVNMRTIFAKIPPGTIKKQALVIAKKVWRLSREQNIWPALPTINYKWVRGWRREWRVSLRRPNAKYKLSRAKLHLRLSYVWRANLSIRWLAHYCLGIQPVVWGCDQKPIYMNEGGHKNMPTCHFEGAELAVAKDNIAQSRERVSIMTTVTSDKAHALSHSLPVALCFKGKTDRILQNLPKGLGKHVIFQHSPKGSYRVEHVVQFLERALPAWTEERAAAKDWRILYLDAYAAHFAQDVVEIAFSRGFVTLWHGAGTTGLLQVNDTHLHASFERIYMEMEGESFAQQQCLDPTDISRHRADVACDVAATWAALDHRSVAKGHVANALCHDLEGGEDVQLSKDVRDAWIAVDGPAMRREIGEEIRQKVAAGEYRWDWDTIQKLSGRDAAERHLGAYATEGRELEAAQQEGEAVFEDKEAEETEEEKEELKNARSKKRKIEPTAVSSQPSHTIQGTVVPARPTDTEVAKRIAEEFAEKRKIVEQVRLAAKGEEWAPTRWNCDRRLQVLLKSYCPNLRVEQEGEDLIKRYMAVEAEAEAAKMEKARVEARKRKALLVKQKLIKQRLQNEAEARKQARQREKETQAAEVAAIKAAKALLERDFSLGELTPQKAKGSKANSRQARLDFLERLRLIHGVTPTVKVYWPHFCEWFVDWIVRPTSKGGPQSMIDLQARLAASASRAKAEGKPSCAFDTWVKEMKKANMPVLEPATTTRL